MSSTNRGAQRHPDDFYRTPAWCVEAILPELRLDTTTPRTLLDPCSGDGAILDVIGSRCVRSGFEIDVDRHQACSAKHPTLLRDALCLIDWQGPESMARAAWGLPESRPDRIVMNPPFSLAMEFVERALREVAPAGIVAALLRLNWLSSAKRAAFHRAHPARVLVLPRRPSFTDNGKTDSTEYAWFIWGRDPGTWALANLGGAQ